MRILHLSNTPLSNAPSNIASCQKHAGHDTRVLIGRKSNINKVFCGGESWAGLSYSEVAEAFFTADVIHFHNFTWDQGIFLFYPKLKEIARSKKKLVQFHSPRNSTENFEPVIADPSFKGARAVVAQYQADVYPEAEFVLPNCLPLHEDRFRLYPSGKWASDFGLTVNYSPSNTIMKGWDYKGHDVIAPLLRKLEQAKYCNSEIVTNTPYEDCLARKAWAHVGVEEFFTGSYHLSFLEYLAYGCATLGNLSENVCRTLEKVIGVDAVLTLPYFKVDPKQNVTEQFIAILRDKKALAEKGLAARVWMLEHFSPVKISALYDKAYAQL